MMWTSLRMAAWLGWQIESNWASPALFALYSIVKPLTSAAILVVMFGIITSGQFESPAFSCMFVGHAFYMYVAAVLGGMAQSVVDDRERFRTLRSMYVAPVHFPLYLVGRGAARFATTSLSVVITLSSGIMFLDVPLTSESVHWGLFGAALAIGVVMLAMLGLILASIVLTVSHGSWVVGEAVAAAMYVFCGAVFPIDVLPLPLRAVGYVLPVTYWLELVRRALLGGAASHYTTFGGLSNALLIGMLVVMTLALGAISVAVFRRCDHVARERGLLDRTTNF
jgi:ABC-2 type transport system permease protein